MLCDTQKTKRIQFKIVRNLLFYKAKRILKHWEINKKWIMTHKVHKIMKIIKVKNNKMRHNPETMQKPNTTSLIFTGDISKSLTTTTLYRGASRSLLRLFYRWFSCLFLYLFNLWFVLFIIIVIMVGIVDSCIVLCFMCDRDIVVSILIILDCHNLNIMNDACIIVVLIFINLKWLSNNTLNV